MADLNQYLTVDSSSKVKQREQRERIKSASVEELREVLNDVQLEVLDLRTKSMMEQLPNPMRVRHIRKLVARIHTELAAREQSAA
jgi:ribosomal protein L29